jgi:hypothetical protein
MASHEFYMRTYARDNLIELMNRSQQNRLATIRAFPEFMSSISRARGKGSQFRKQLHRFLCVGAYKVFETEEKEYQYICKYGRGDYWDIDRLETTFNEDEMLTIRLIAKGFGAFDY